MSPFLLILAGIVVFPSCSQAATGNLCSIIYANLALVKDSLYFMSGGYHYDTYTNTTESVISSNLYRIALDDNFPVGSNIIPSQFLDITTIPQDIPGAQANALDISDGYAGALFYTDDLLYVYGGAELNSSHDVLSAYEVSQTHWSNVTVTGGAYNDGSHVDGLWTSVPESSLSFWVGGYDPQIGSSVLRFDASDAENLVWTNESLDHGSYGTEVPKLVGGSMVYIPAGDEGMLVVYGGWNYSVSADITDYSSYADMSLIYVYDIATHTWWEQLASGDIPRPRRQFCSVASTAPDSSAFHLAMYGGWDGIAEQGYGDLHILSLPSFTWIDVSSVAWDSDSEQNANRTVGRYAHSCLMFKNSEMIVLGGQVIINTPDGFVAAPDCSSYDVLRVLDLSTFEWPTRLDLDPSYKVPPAVYKQLGGEASGGATKTVPDAGFADPTLASCIQQRVHPTTTTPPPKPPKDTGPKTNAGALAGEIIAAVAIVCLIVGLVVWLRRRSKRRQQLQQQAEDGGARGFDEKLELDGQDRERVELEDSRRMSELDGKSAHIVQAGEKGRVVELPEERS